MSTESTWMTFEHWCIAIDVEAESRGYGISYIAITGAECWIDYYVSGYSPEDALIEEESYC